MIESAVHPMVMEKEPEVVLPRLSLTCTVNVDVPIVVGTPVMSPAAESVRPAGRVPEVTDQV